MLTRWLIIIIIITFQKWNNIRWHDFFLFSLFFLLAQIHQRKSDALRKSRKFRTSFRICENIGTSVRITVPAFVIVSAREIAWMYICVHLCTYFGTHIHTHTHRDMYTYTVIYVDTYVALSPFTVNRRRYLLVRSVKSKPAFYVVLADLTLPCPRFSRRSWGMLICAYYDVSRR